MLRLRHALAFLTRLPGGRHPEGATDLTGAVPWFPVVGLLMGAVGAAVFAALSLVVSPLAAAAAAFTVTAVVTGGFHEDGLADSFDALAGGGDKAQRLAILKDSRQGTFGVLSLVMVSALKISALAPLGGWVAAGALVAAHCGGRAGAVVLMGMSPRAREDGLGADYTRELAPGATIIGGLIGAVSIVVAFGVWSPVVLAVTAAGVAAVGLWAQRKIGGVTGDILGAAEQVGECMILLAASAILV